MVLHELESGLRHHSLITNQEQLQHYRELLSVVREEYEDIVKNEVQRAIAADEDALSRLCSNYIDNVRAYTQREKVRNRYTGNYGYNESSATAVLTFVASIFARGQTKK